MLYSIISIEQRSLAMTLTLPNDPLAALDWTWEEYKPFYDELLAYELDASNVEEWLRKWNAVGDLAQEAISRLHVQANRDTSNSEAEQTYVKWLGTVYPALMAVEQPLRQKLLSSGLEPEGFAIPLRNMRAEAALFREENVPLLSEESQVANEYTKITGVQTVQWQGEERTLRQLQPVLQSADRAEREQVWRLIAERQLADRAAINETWRKLMALRGKIAANADCPTYRDYIWPLRQRFDYTPEDCARFHNAIEEAVVPVARWIYNRRRERLGVETLRPWDLDAVLPGDVPLQPFENGDELEERAAAMLGKVDAIFGEQFNIMRQEGLLDLINRKGKANGGYCTSFPVTGRPFIFMNGVGLADDVRVVLHEAGHAFHVFATTDLPYRDLRSSPTEFAEVASMSMELLASPYIGAEHGGFYADPRAAARARREHLENIILFWPYMAVVDAFQHWIYNNHELGSEPIACDAVWGQLWDRFMPGVDWGGLLDEKVTGWQRKLHIHRIPFYYVEYGLAQLGAVQVWRNSMRDQASATAAYRHALSLGGSVPLPELFSAAGARFAFDTATMQEAVDLLQEQIAELMSSD
jgi:oligoendopeptidase F